MSLPNPYRLLVEGNEDKRVLPELIEKNGVLWEPAPKQYYAEIEECGGVDNIAKTGFIGARFKQTNLQALGIVIDADGLTENHQSLVDNVLLQCRTIIPDHNWTLNENGIIAHDHLGKRLGLWVMPDNCNPGMLENLLLTLPPANQASLLEFARNSVGEAHAHGAPYRAVHRDKAIIHTWLSWQDPPGRQLHQAIQENMLQPNSAIAARFMGWFSSLFPPIQ